MAAILAPAAAFGASATPPKNLPDGWFKVQGRTVTISLPQRGKDGWVWVSATGMVAAEPFGFVDIDIKPKAGPGGTDLTVYTYLGTRPGRATLEFGLVPAGKMLLGPKKLVYQGPVAKTFKADVTVK